MMPRHSCKGFIFVVTVVLITVSAQAKRLPAKPVPPVISGGVRYSVENDGADQYVVASNVTDGAELWKVKIFHTHVKFWIEEDNQAVFITSMQLDGNSLLVADERSRCYSVNLTTKKVHKQSCSALR